jgi:hypothetical protein
MQKLETFATYQNHQLYGDWIFEALQKVLKFVKETNTCGTEKCHLLPAVHFICSLQYEATISTVTEQTAADILCAVKC